MLFDFKEAYASKSNEELVQIIARPSGYQPEAVAAANTLLTERGLTAEDIGQILYPPVTEATVGLAPFGDGQTDIFGEIGMKPLSPETRKKILFVGISWGALYLFNILTIGVSYAGAAEYLDLVSIIAAVIGMFISLTPLMFVYRLYKRKMWGWLMSVFFLCLFCLAQVRAILQLFEFSAPPAGFLIALFRYYPVAALAVYATSLVLLYGRQLREELHISNEIAWRPAAIAGAVALLIFLLLF